MKAVNLDQVITFFDPERPLVGQHLRTWYVQRPETPRGYLRRLLLNAQSTKHPVKVLFVGHRGSGKSTELNKLSEEIRNEFEALPFDLLEIAGRITPSYADLMLALSTQITRYCIDHTLIERPVGDSLRGSWRELSDWWLKLVAGLDVRPAGDEVETYAQLSALLGQVEVGAKRSSVTHEQVIGQIRRQMSELIRRLNLVLNEAQERLNPRRLFIVVEGLDKVNLQAAREMFRDYAETITALEADMVYTYPLALRHSDDFRTVRGFFSDHCFLQNISVHQMDGSMDPQGRHALRQLVLARMESRLVAVEALEQAIHASGGIPIDLVKLMRSAALHALDRDEQALQITASDIQKAVRNARDDISASLSQTDWLTLRLRHHDRRITSEPEMQRLFYMGALVEYTNHMQWCDVHPLLWDLLDYYAPVTAEEV